MKVTIFIEGERLDLFEDESINITQGVQDVRDISKLFADFSQSFNVPASDNNNRIFKHYYNADIDGGFDARTRKNAVINVNTLDFKRGKLQLENVKIKDNSPASYNITFFGDAIKFKDEIGDDKLFDLDFLSNFDHDYTFTNIKEALVNGLDFVVDGEQYEKAIIYPLISYFKQYKYDSDPSDTTNTDNLVNIAYNASRSQGVDYSDLKPAIKLSVIIEAIQRKYGFNFIGTFFESQNYTELYMSLNNKEDRLNSGILTFEQESGSNGFITNTTSRLKYKCEITPLPGFENIEYKLRLTYNGQNVYEDQTFRTGAVDKTVTITVDSRNYDVSATVITEEDFEFDAETRLFKTFFGVETEVFFNNTYSNLSIDLKTLILEQIYDIKVYDLITSIFKMFNLIVTSEGEDLLVESLQYWYSSGNIYDISEYVDTSKLTVEKGKVYNEFDFKFEESEQILADQYNNNNRRYYGNLEQKIYTDETQTKLLDGDSLDIEVVFENPVFERLQNQDNGALTSIQYCPYFDKDLNPITGNPFLFYANQNSVSTNTIGYNFSNDPASYEELDTVVFMPSHSRVLVDNNTFAINFSAELSEYTYALMGNNIYSTYYQDYISDIFSIKRRNFKLEAKLPDWLLNKLKLNDRLIINDRRYINNKITSNLVNRKDNLELINDIYDAPLASDVLNSSLFSPAAREHIGVAETDNTNYIGLEKQTPKLVDTGDGITWLSIDSFGTGSINQITYSVEENTSGSVRSAQIEIVDNINNPRFTIYQENLN